MYNLSRYCTGIIIDTQYSIAGFFDGVARMTSSAIWGIKDGVKDQRNVYNASRRYR